MRGQLCDHANYVQLYKIRLLSWEMRNKAWFLPGCVAIEHCIQRCCGIMLKVNELKRYPLYNITPIIYTVTTHR